MSWNQALYGSCIILTGLLAGLFYGYQCSVINGLGRLGNREYLLAFQHVNSAILNPVFFLSFIGSLIVMIVTTMVMYRSGNTALFPYLLAATAIYAIGVFGITIACNVPLNNAVAALNIQAATSEEIGRMRLGFEAKWNKWHLIRTVASTISFAILVLPLIKKI